MKDFVYIIDDKVLCLSPDEEISYRQGWKLVQLEITDKNKSIARVETVKEKYSCEYKKIKSFTDLENLIIV